MFNTRVIATQYGGPEVLELIQEPLRVPDRGELRIIVESAGVALADVMRRLGKYPLSPTPPFTPGYDVIGVVDELGEGVETFAKGQRIGVLFNGTGGYAEHVYAKMEEVVPVPAGIDRGLAVAAILNYVSAYQMLHRIAKVSEGERILIHGASGGVGTALLELGRLAKLKMFGTASSAKHSIVSDFGATPIDYRNEDFVEILHRRDSVGIDAVFDPIGASNYERSLQTLSKGGRFVAYGYTSILHESDTNDWQRDWNRLAETPITDRGHHVHLYSVTSLKQQRLDWFKEDVGILLSLLEEGKIRPLISHRVPLRHAAKAHELLEQSLHVGKIVLEVD